MCWIVCNKKVAFDFTYLLLLQFCVGEGLLLNKQTDQSQTSRVALYTKGCSWVINVGLCASFLLNGKCDTELFSKPGSFTTVFVLADSVWIHLQCVQTGILVMINHPL